MSRPDYKIFLVYQYHAFAEIFKNENQSFTNFKVVSIIYVRNILDIFIVAHIYSAKCKIYFQKEVIKKIKWIIKMLNNSNCINNHRQACKTSQDWNFNIIQTEKLKML